MKLGSRLVKTGDLGLGGNLYGGRMLEWLAEQAALYAMELTGHAHMVGYRFDNVVLSRPVRSGEILTFTGAEPRYGVSSVTFAVQAAVGTETALTAVCTFVAVDADGKKCALQRI